MNNSERTKLINQAGVYVNAKCEIHKNIDRVVFIEQASGIYDIKLSTLLMILE